MFNRMAEKENNQGVARVHLKFRLIIISITMPNIDLVRAFRPGNELYSISVILVFLALKFCKIIIVLCYAECGLVFAPLQFFFLPTINKNFMS